MEPVRLDIELLNARISRMQVGKCPHVLTGGLAVSRAQGPSVKEVAQLELAAVLCAVRPGAAVPDSHFVASLRLCVAEACSGVELE